MNKLNISTYEILKKKVRETLLLGRQRIEEEKVRTYWRTGKLIHEHILAHRDRAEFGKHVLKRLSKDLGVSETSLYETLQLARAFPIFGTCRKLTWSHLRRLARIPDERKRLELLKSAEEREWTSRELQARVSKIKALAGSRSSVSTSAVNVKPLEAPALGPFWTYQIKDSESIHAKRSGMLWVDLGFQTYLEAERFESYRLKTGSIVTSVKDENKIYTLKQDPSLTAGHLYTYQAYVERVIDADTIKVQVDLGFDTWTRQTLRLRGIDAFEVDTKEGKRAKEFVERELKSVPFVTLKSTRDDKYGRYLADVFYAKNQYLNQSLLDHKFAVKV